MTGAADNTQSSEAAGQLPRLSSSPDGVRRLDLHASPVSIGNGALAKDLLAAMGKRPTPSGWSKPRGGSRLREASGWLQGHMIDEVRLHRSDRYSYTEINDLNLLLEGSPCALYQDPRDTRGSKTKRSQLPRTSQEYEEPTPWIADFIYAREQAPYFERHICDEMAERHMRNGYQTAMSLTSYYWRSYEQVNSGRVANREMVFAAIIADASPQRRALRAAGAQCALLQYGFLVEINGEPTSRELQVDYPEADERVRKLSDPAAASARVIGLIPISHGALLRIPAAAITERKGNEISLCGYRFSGQLATALRAGVGWRGSATEPEDKVTHSRYLAGTDLHGLPTSLGGLQVTFTDLRKPLGVDSEPFIHQCAIIYQLAKFGWNKTVRVRDTPARRQAATELVALGLLQEIADLQYTSTRSLRSNQFDGLQRGEVRLKRKQKAHTKRAFTEPCFFGNGPKLS